VIGKFIYRHQEQITTELFTNITRSVLNHTGSDASSVAGDGTIIEAACSHYNLLKQEAVTQALECARQEASNNPEDTNAQARLALANKASDILQSRIEHNKSNYKKKENLRINPQEPDAVIQRQKRGIGVAPSYKPSILSNDRRIITAHAIHASSETAVGAQMLDQSEVINGVKTDELLLDAGYCCGSILNESIAREISLLCPEGRKLGKGKCSAKRYMKGDFEYNEELDTYKCPAGQILMLESTRKSNDGREYGTKACQSCVLREKCTTSKKGRKVIRYPHDEYKEALRTVMEQKQAKIRFGQRKAWVEPVFSVLRGAQNLNRFRRKGIEAVHLEFGLHVLAYNIGRLIAYLNCLNRFYIASLEQFKLCIECVQRKTIMRSRRLSKEVCRNIKIAA